jgi:SAM-dependent methyltransferase
MKAASNDAKTQGAGAAREAMLSAYRQGAGSNVGLTWPLIRALEADWPGPSALYADELLAELLVSEPIFPIWLERRLTALRRRFLLEGAEPAAEPLLARLAIQCQLNDFAWFVEVDEAAEVARRAARIGDLSATEAMALACYRPLGHVDGADALLARGWTGPVQAVLLEHVIAVRREQALQSRIPSITSIGEGVSEAVRGQYEASPYPRWRKVTQVTPARSIFGWRVPAAPNVLVAGCGTGYHAIHAGQRYGGGRILAVDLSRASLGYGLRKVREAGIGNIAFAQADLLKLGETSFKFDAIECSGVLHHLADPLEGLRVLAGRLKPGGIMKIGLYSALARANLKPAKALACRFTPETIPALRKAITDAPDGDPVKAPMRFTDFYSGAACRDLLMHVQEHELGIEDIRRMLAEVGLTFMAFGLEPDLKAAYRAMFPGDPAATDLANWAAFEQAKPMTFQHMYQFWVRKPG